VKIDEEAGMSINSGSSGFEAPGSRFRAWLVTNEGSPTPQSDSTESSKSYVATADGGCAIPWLSGAP
jgi:hypothetical protein